MPRVPKPTMSQDGKARMTVQVEFRIDVYGLVGAAVLKYGQAFRDAIDADQPRPRITRSGVMGELRSRLYIQGTGGLEFAPWDENWGADVEDEIQAAVHQVFPEFGEGS